MKFHFNHILISLVALTLLSSCSQGSLKYQLDPEFSHITEAARYAKIVAVKIIDSRPTFSEFPSEQQVIPSKHDDEAAILHKKLIERLKQENYKIISKPLLADIAFEIDITALEMSVETSTFKSIIRGKSEFKLTVRKKSQHWSKIFRASRTQEVANPVNDVDATGIVNQMFTNLLANAFSDPSLEKFVSKEQ